MLEEKEALQLLSKVRLGASIGWFDVSPGLFTRLLVLIGRAHIQQLISSEEDENVSKKINQTRARLVQFALGFASE
jgi:protein-arginine kinase